jgi:FkbM family methyltransferase
LKLLNPKKLLFLLPRWLRFKIFNIKTLKFYKTKTGNYYLPFFALRDVVRNTIVDDKIFDYDVYKYAELFVKEDTIVIDAGANYGQMSILFSQLKPNVIVYAFEAYKYISDILIKNVKANKANVKVFNCVLGDKSIKNLIISDSTLKTYNNYGSNVVEFNEKNSSGNLVDAIKIDDLDLQKKISFMKIDVQGYDLKVLIGAKKTIKKNKMPIIVEYSKEFEDRFNYKFSDFLKILEQFNYKIEKKITEANYLIVYDNKLDK